MPASRYSSVQISRAAELALGDEIRHGARSRPVVRALAIAADRVLVPQAPVGLSLGPFLDRHFGAAAAVLPPCDEEGALPVAVELAVARVAARHQLGQPPEEVRRERLRVVEHGELGRRGSQRRSVALPERSHALRAYGKRRMDSRQRGGGRSAWPAASEGGVMKQWTIRLRMVPVVVADPRARRDGVAPGGVGEVAQTRGGAAGRGADLEHVHGERGSRLDSRPRSRPTAWSTCRTRRRRCTTP